MHTDNFLKDLENNENQTGIAVSLSGENGNVSISIKYRFNKGEPLSTTTIENASESQLDAVCNLLDNL